MTLNRGGKWSGVALSRLARLTAQAILLLDLTAGLGFLLGAPSRTRVPAYKPIHDLLAPVVPGDPARWWGGALVLLVIIALAAVTFGRSEVAARRCFSLLLAYWAMFAVGYAWAWANDGATLAGFALAGISCIGHLRPIIAAQRLTVRRGPPAEGG